MNLHKLIVGPLETNCYILWAQEGEEGIIIDPGADGEAIRDFVTKKNIKPCIAVNTHSHFDHVGANAELKQLFPSVKIAIGAMDADAMVDPAQNLSAGFGIQKKMPAADILLREGDTVEFGECSLRVYSTPGHTGGAISLASEEEVPKKLFCGDLIFADGFGRTDLPGGDENKLRESIKKVLSSFPDDTELYPGHGPAFSLEKGRSQIEWYMKGL